VRREVFERDGAQCTFTDGEGSRCSARGFLELDHIESRALGGSSDASNLRVLCRAHNQLHAEEVFGREHVARQIHVRQRTLARVEVPEIPLADVATRGLVGMGFREKEVRRALDVVFTRHSTGEVALPIEEILREALAVLA
jgi:hypothetical protein